MATYFLFGKYSGKSIKKISAERTTQAEAVLKELGGKLLSGYVLLGQHDLVLIVDLPGNEEAVKASVALTRLTKIGFSTSPAVSVEEFDKMMSG